MNMRELIIDITYQCNSECRYCQWSHSNKEVNRNIPIHQLLVPEKTLNILDISRVVITGGEPILSENIDGVIGYYKKLSIPIRLISNGLGLNQNKLDHLTKQGVSEFVISLDSTNYETYSKIRAISKNSFKTILANITHLSNFINNSGNFLGLNVVLTSINCNWKEISQILSFAKENKIQQVKFQPVFDDGYLSRNAPELFLDDNSIPELNRIITNFQEYKNINGFTNPPHFWSDLNDMVAGDILDPNYCDVAQNAVLLHGGILKFCFWCQHGQYGKIEEDLTRAKAEKRIQQFEKNLKMCQVRPQCFCLQSINHKWKNNGGEN